MSSRGFLCAEMLWRASSNESGRVKWQTFAHPEWANFKAMVSMIRVVLLSLAHSCTVILTHLGT